MKMRKGFTLIELLIVIAIIAVLAGVAFVALNPLQRFQDARDATRWSDVTAVLDAIKVDQVDNGGAYAATIVALANGAEVQLGTADVGCDASCTATANELAACLELDADLVIGGYLSAIPVDPTGGAFTAAETGYYLVKNANGTVTVGACDPEGGDPISVSR